MIACRCMQAALAALLVVTLASCSREAEKATRTEDRCHELGGEFAARIVEQFPLSDLARSTRDDVQRALARGKICLQAATASHACNAGDTRQADIRRCCQFTSAVEAHVTNLPERLELRDEDGIAVTLDIRTELKGLATSNNCAVPTCSDDVTAARPQVRLRGEARTEAGSARIAIDFDLEEDLTLVCRLP